ncbi:3-dehydroquinate dehydratase [Sodalis praecaptivus]
MADKFHILLLNGPNLNLLGTREPDKYGHTALADIIASLGTLAGSLGAELSHFQSNAEHALIDRIHQARGIPILSLSTPRRLPIPASPCAMRC